MHPALQRNTFLVKEHVGIFKAANEYNIFDPETGEQILEAREPNLGIFAKMFRFTDYKTMTPFDVHIAEPNGGPLAVRVNRGVTFFLSKVGVEDDKGENLGGFKQKLFSFGGAFNVMDASGEPVCMLKGKFTGWEFKFTDKSGNQLARVTKKWAGMGKELFTSADNYVLIIEDSVPAEDPVRQLIMAAVICIDMVLKE